MHGNETSVIHKVLVNVSSEHAYLILCLCILGTVNIVLGSLPLPLFFFLFWLLFFFSPLFLSLFVDCMTLHAVVVMVCSVCSLFLFLYKFSFCVFLSAHCGLAGDHALWGSSKGVINFP